jgi:Fe-S cluster assembly iron-binding protein IscA
VLQTASVVALPVAGDSEVDGPLLVFTVFRVIQGRSGGAETPPNESSGTLETGGHQMVEVTERAREELKKALDAQSQSEIADAGLRLALVGPDEFGLGVDTEKQGDEVVEHAGAKVLMIEGPLAEQLSGVTIDVHETEMGPRLVMSKSQ